MIFLYKRVLQNYSDIPKTLKTQQYLTILSIIIINIIIIITIIIIILIFIIHSFA